MIPYWPFTFGIVQEKKIRKKGPQHVHVSIRRSCMFICLVYSRQFSSPTHSFFTAIGLCLRAVNGLILPLGKWMLSTPSLILLMKTVEQLFANSPRFYRPCWRHTRGRHCKMVKCYNIENLWFDFNINPLSWNCLTVPWIFI